MKGTTLIEGENRAGKKVRGDEEMREEEEEDEETRFRYPKSTQTDIYRR